MAEIGTVIEGKYEILREIGKGGMSVVYLAMDTHLNKQWAVKEIRKRGSGKNDEIVVNSLLAEANLMKRLDHPALPRIVDIIDNGVTIFVVMDYIEGESLDKILKEYNKLFDVIDSAIDNVQSASAYDQLSFYNGVFMLLYDQRSSMVQVAVNQDKVINLLDDVYKKATSLEVQKEQSQKLKNEMTNNYDDYRNAIIRAYTNAQERS